jgi:replication-associated recombination protein RarA
MSDRKKAGVRVDLFDYMRNNAMAKEAPLASRMRPATLDEVVGQQILSVRINYYTEQ